MDGKRESFTGKNPMVRIQRGCLKEIVMQIVCKKKTTYEIKHHKWFIFW
jgi:hypothetical protein